MGTIRINVGDGIYLELKVDQKLLIELLSQKDPFKVYGDCQVYVPVVIEGNKKD